MYPHILLFKNVVKNAWQAQIAKGLAQSWKKGHVFRAYSIHSTESRTESRNSKRSHPDPLQSKDKATWLVRGLPGLTDPATVIAEPGQWDWRNYSQWEDNNTLDVDKELPHFQKEEKKQDSDK